MPYSSFLKKLTEAALQEQIMRRVKAGHGSRLVPNELNNGCSVFNSHPAVSAHFTSHLPDLWSLHKSIIKQLQNFPLIATLKKFKLQRLYLFSCEVWTHVNIKCRNAKKPHNKPLVSLIWVQLQLIILSLTTYN